MYYGEIFCGVQLDDYLINDLLANTNHEHGGTIIECGASDGVYCSHSKAFEDKGWRAICLEPSRSKFMDLARNRPDATTLNLALSSSQGRRTFFDETRTNPITSTRHGWGSIDKPQHENQSSNSVNCITYDKLIDLLNLKCVDVMVLDVEGHEMEVLKGMTKIFPKILVVEIDKITLSGLHKWAEKTGYSFVRADDINAVFIKSN